MPKNLIIGQLLGAFKSGLRYVCAQALRVVLHLKVENKPEKCGKHVDIQAANTVTTDWFSMC